MKRGLEHLKKHENDKAIQSFKQAKIIANGLPDMRHTYEKIADTNLAKATEAHRLAAPSRSPQATWPPSANDKDLYTARAPSKSNIFAHGIGGPNPSASASSVSSNAPVLFTNMGVEEPAPRTGPVVSKQQKPSLLFSIGHHLSNLGNLGSWLAHATAETMHAAATGVVGAAKGALGAVSTQASAVSAKAKTPAGKAPVRENDKYTLDRRLQPTDFKLFNEIRRTTKKGESAFSHKDAGILTSSSQGPKLTPAEKAMLKSAAAASPRYNIKENQGHIENYGTLTPAEKAMLKSAAAAENYGTLQFDTIAGGKQENFWNAFKEESARSSSERAAPAATTEEAAAAPAAAAAHGLDLSSDPASERL